VKQKKKDEIIKIYKELKISKDEFIIYVNEVLEKI